MTIVRVLTLVSLGVVCITPNVVAQSLSRYRSYALESSLTSIVKASGAREADLKTLHDRPENSGARMARRVCVPWKRRARSGARHSVLLL